MWNVQIHDAVKRKLKQTPEPDKGRIKDAICRLQYKPQLLDIKKLAGRDGYRLRVGKWRLLLDMDKENQEISVYFLGSRGEVYKNKNL